MAGEWAILLALTGVVAVAVVALIAVLAWRRRRAADDDPAARLAAGQRAMRQMSRDARQRRRGTVRGEGMGGNDSLASDASMEV